MYSTLIALLSAAFILLVTGNPIDKETFLKSPRDAASYAAAALSAHNILRAQHSAGAMTWDDNLASSARDLATSCVYGHDTYVLEVLIHIELFVTSMQDNWIRWLRPKHCRSVLGHSFTKR